MGCLSTKEAAAVASTPAPDYVDGIVYPALKSRYAADHCNTWNHHVSWTLTHGDRTAALCRIGRSKGSPSLSSSSWSTIRSTAGYYSGTHTIDFVLPELAFTGISLGLVSESFDSWNNRLGGHSGGTGIDSDTGKVIGRGGETESLGAFGNGTVKCVRFVLKFDPSPGPVKWQIYYDDTIKLTTTVSCPGRDLVFYVAMSCRGDVTVPITMMASHPSSQGHAGAAAVVEAKSVEIKTAAPPLTPSSTPATFVHVTPGGVIDPTTRSTASLQSTPTATAAGVIDSIVYPVEGEVKSQDDEHDQWRAQMADLQQSHDAAMKHERAQLHLECSALVATAVAERDAAKERALQQLTRDRDAQFDALQQSHMRDRLRTRTEVDGMTRVHHAEMATKDHIIAQLTEQLADINDSLSTHQLEARRSGHDIIGDRKVQLGEGWSAKISDYEFVERLGGRSNAASVIKFYGVCGAVYRARLTPEARTRAIAAGASSLCHTEFALKICYNFDESLTYEKIVAAAKMELNVFNRLPRHDGIVRIEHYFTASIPSSPYPVDWSADPTIVVPRSLFIIMELCYLSLQDVISHRRALNRSPLFRGEEVMMVARDISSALILLEQQLVAHRDIKPDNILIRLPIGVSRASALDNICQYGITIALADFGLVLDFQANERKSMSMVVPVGMQRGGAQYTIAPEIANRSLPCELNYEKADVWSLGVILATMMTTTTDVAAAAAAINGKTASDVTSSSSSSATTVMVARCMDMITRTMTALPSDRWSCRQVHRKGTDAFLFDAATH